MGVYLNPKMVEWFNEWQSTPDLLGMDLENQQELLNRQLDYSGVTFAWGSMSDEEEQGLKSWLFFFMSMYEESWMKSSFYNQNSAYWEWLSSYLLSGENPAYGLNSDMILAMAKNYQSNFIEEFNRRGHLWWDWNFVFLDGDIAPTYPPLFGHGPRRKFESIINWNSNPFEVKR